MNVGMGSCGTFFAFLKRFPLLRRSARAFCGCARLLSMGAPIGAPGMFAGSSRLGVFGRGKMGGVPLGREFAICPFESKQPGGAALRRLSKTEFGMKGPTGELRAKSTSAGG